MFDRYRYFPRPADLSERDKAAVLQTFDEAMKNGVRTSTCYCLAAQVLQRRHRGLDVRVHYEAVDQDHSGRQDRLTDR
jgi:hypothetical protein